MSGSRSFPTSDASESPERNEVVLSIKTVYKMLPLVQRIAQDVIEGHRAIDGLQPEQIRLDKARHSLTWPERKRRYEIREEVGKAEKELEIAHAELRELGLVVLDELIGRIGFPTMVNNRRAYFSWLPNEEGLKNWRFADEEQDRPIPTSWMKEVALVAK